MPTLREVITRFRLDTNERDYSDFNQKLSTMKGGLRSLATAFGVSLGVAGAIGIAKLGNNLERAKFQLDDLLGFDKSKIEQMKSAFDSVSKRIEIMRTGASQAFSKHQFDEAAASYVRVFGAGADELDAFGRIFEFAAVQSIRTKKSVVEITDAITNAINTGGLEAFLDIPGFDQKSQKWKQFILDVQNPNEPGGQTAVAQRRAMVMEIMADSAESGKRALEKIPEKLLAADRASNKLQESIEKLGSIITDSLIEPLKELVNILTAVANKFGIIKKAATDAGVNPAAVMTANAAKALIPDSILGGVSTEQAAQGISKGAEYAFTKKGRAAWANEIRKEFNAGNANIVQGAEELIRGTASIIITNHYNIQSSDPRKVSEEIVRKQKEQLERAQATTSPTEAR
jgi:hypothetical protein